VPLNKESLKSAIQAALASGEDKTIDETADALATAIDEYIRSMTITVAGIATAGTAAAQTQVSPVTATIS